MTPETASSDTDAVPSGTALRRGWTTGACATAAAKAAATALLTGRFADPAEITLPKGQQVAFALAEERLSDGGAMAAIIKDAGDDPDVTHGATIRASVRRNDGQGIRLLAGEGVGTVTREGLPIAVGAPSITPVPRQMIETVLGEVAAAHGVAADFDATFSIDNGEALAAKTLNGRLGIVGGLSILGTTGIVIPYSCSSWIHSIHRGIDVARAAGLTHLIAATGERSETAANARLQLPEAALIDMGDFAGAVLKYLRDHPVPRLTIAGGPGKLSKLAQGRMDLHSRAGQVDVPWLSAEAGIALPQDEEIVSAAQLMRLAADQGKNQALADFIAARARDEALRITGQSCRIDVLLVDRQGDLLAQSGTA